MITSHFLNPISKMFVNFFTAIEYGKTQTLFLSASSPETEETNKLAKNKIRFEL